MCCRRKRCRAIRSVRGCSDERGMQARSRAASRFRILCRHALGLGDMFGRIDVEERIDGRRRPSGNSERITRAPFGDPAHAVRAVSARRKSSRNSTGQIATTGCGRSPELAQARSALAPTRARCRRATKSRGRNGQSPGALTTHSICGRMLRRPIEARQDAGERARHSPARCRLQPGGRYRRSARRRHWH